ncbi:MAG: hypothetical protein AAFQ65_14465 [Myxococcota bacterium]
MIAFVDPSVVLRVVLAASCILHLASALLLQEFDTPEFRFATHDEQLGTAARACGLEVVGV